MFKSLSKRTRLGVISDGERVRDCWRTPRPLFEKLHAVFHFTVDACASPSNALLPRYWTRQDDCLAQDWTKHIVFCNPPFSLQKCIPAKASTATQAVIFIYGTGMFTRFMERNPPSYVIFPPGRIPFVPPKGISMASNPPFGVAICVYGDLSREQRQSLATFGLVLHSQQDGGTPMPVHLTDKEMAHLNLTVNGDGTEVVPMPPADHPSESMNDTELLIYAAKQEGLYADLACRSVIPFFRRGWALSIVFSRHPMRWTAICKDNKIGRTWATYARKFYAHYKEESAIPSGKTLNELLVEAGILVQKVNTDAPGTGDGGTRRPKSSGDPTGTGVDEGGGDQPGEDEDSPKGEAPSRRRRASRNGENGTTGSKVESSDSGQGPPAKEDSLLLRLTKTRDCLALWFENKDQIDWPKEDLAACKAMLWEIISVCDSQWINEVDDHDLRKAS